MSIELMMLSNHFILCCPLLLLPSIFPSIRVFSNESVLHIRWPKYWSFSFSINCSNEYSGLIPFRIDCFDLLVVQETSRVFSSTTVQNSSVLSLPYGPTPISIHDYWQDHSSFGRSCLSNCRTIQNRWCSITPSIFPHLYIPYKEDKPKSSE